MEEFWTSSSPSVRASMHAAKFLSEGDNVWEYFPCPFCYVDVEVPVLCAHLQEEHCFDTKNAVCPVCAENLGKDMTAHFTIQHSHMLKRRKPQRNGLWSKEPHELGYFPGKRGNAAPDPLLLSFISYPDSVDDNQETDCDNTQEVVSNEQSSKPFSEHEREELTQRAEFFQQILLSTIF